MCSLPSLYICLMSLSHGYDYRSDRRLFYDSIYENVCVTRPEALFMLIMYGVYCIALRFNTELERWALTLPLPFKLPTREEQAALVTYRSYNLY